MSIFNESEALRIDQVIEVTGLSRSMIYKLISEKKFPEGAQLGGRNVVWRRGVVNQWMRDRARGGRGERLPLIYMAGRMGKAIDNKRPGAGGSCWRIIDVSMNDDGKELDILADHRNVLIETPMVVRFQDTNVAFQYSGPWKAYGQYHGYTHGVTSPSPSSEAYIGALRGIARADIFVAYIDDLEAYGTLVEIGFARALGKRIIVANPKGIMNEFNTDSFEQNLWFAFKSADRHLVIDRQVNDDKYDLWLKAHQAIAEVVAEWYPVSVMYDSVN